MGSRLHVAVSFILNISPYKDLRLHDYATSCTIVIPHTTVPLLLVAPRELSLSPPLPSMCGRQGKGGDLWGG